MIGIRKEDKNRWEARAPLSPEHVAALVNEHGIGVRVEPSPIRAFPAADYEAAGAHVSSDLTGCSVIFGVKEVPVHLLLEGRVYVFFAHVAKGQPHNMPMLRRILEIGGTLVDYEKIADEQGRRLIFFGREAGHSAMLDSLWALGRRLRAEGLANPFEDVRQALGYTDLSEAKGALRAVGDRIRREGLPAPVAPMIFGFAGYGNTYRGTADVFDVLPVEEIDPSQVEETARRGAADRVYKVVFHEHHTVEPAAPGAVFDLKDFYAHPENYRSVFRRFLSRLSVLMNCVYWEPRFPRLVTKEDLRKLWSGPEPPRLRVIGDISCDVGGSVECTVRCTDSGDPVLVYDPLTGRDTLGVEGRGVVVLAVDNLPCELPVDSSRTFGNMLLRFVPALARCDWSRPLDQLDLPPEILKAVIVHRGKLTPGYAYLEDHLAVS